jgi:hypothetical protein
MCFDSWLGEIDKHAQAGGLEVMDCEIGAFRPSLVPLCTNTYLMGHVELFQGLAKLNGHGASIPPEKDCQLLLLTLFAETKKNAVYHWPPVTLLARKPSSITSSA